MNSAASVFEFDILQAVFSFAWSHYTKQKNVIANIYIRVFRQLHFLADVSTKKKNFKNDVINGIINHNNKHDTYDEYHT